MQTLVGRWNHATLGFLTVALAVVVISYLLGAGAAPALDNCQDCDCKMLYAWKVPADSYASGMQTQGLTPAKILFGTAIQAKLCPDPPKPCRNATLVDRYEYQNPALTCTDQINSRLKLEADVAGAGTRVALGINHSTCIEQAANCLPIPGSE